MSPLYPAFLTRFSLASHLLVAVLLLGGSLAATAQPTATVTISNFNVFPGEYYPPPHASQPKSQLQGSQGLRLSPERYRVTVARLTTFREDGSREMVVEAPECIYEQGSRSASSAGPLKMGTADNKFLIEGVGFLWRQTNSSISISNDVHTVVQAELLAQSGSAPAADSSRSSEPLHIFSRRFDYSGETGMGNYREEVRVVGTNLGLSSRLLTVQVPMKERQLQTITADGSVAIDYSGVRATGERAVYRADTGLANITGQPRWSTEQREGSADELIIDATNRLLHANGQARLKMTGQTFGTFGAHGAPAAPPAPLTNHYVEISSDTYELGTNSASFRKNVRAREWAAEQVRSTLNCGELTAWYSGTNQLQRMIADQGVLIEQQDEQLRAGKAVYTSTNGLLELTDRPTWRSGAREGRGQRMVMVVPENELSVQGDAYLKLPANEAGRTPGTPPVEGPGVTNQFAELFSEQYVVRPQVALFEGKVRLAHPQLQMSCDHMAVHSAADTQTGQNLTAEHSVVFDLLSSDGQKVHGTCQKAFYDYGVRGGLTNDVLELTGNPILETTNGSVQNSVLILDRARNKLIVPSVEQARKANAGADSRRYRIALAVGAIPTNRFPMLKR